MTIGLISGALGPFTNAPIDTIKTRIQRASRVEGETAISRVVSVASDMFRQEGPSAFWKGITPRVARVAPGQSVVFLCVVIHLGLRTGGCCAKIALLLTPSTIFFLALFWCCALPTAVSTCVSSPRLQIMLFA